MRTRTARQHRFGHSQRVAWRSHLSGQGHRPTCLSLGATGSRGYVGAVRVRMSAGTRGSTTGGEQSAAGERTAEWHSRDGASIVHLASTPLTTLNQLHVQLEVPFVFHATGPPPAPVEDTKVLPIDSHLPPIPALITPLPPGADQQSPEGIPIAAANRPPERGFFRRLGGFFSALFR